MEKKALEAKEISVLAMRKFIFLKKELADVKMERDILKKAIANFSKQKA
jgi:transposase-like protein